MRGRLAVEPRRSDASERIWRTLAIRVVEDDQPRFAGRDLRIDFLHGYLALAMVVDHVCGPSWLYAVTSGNRFFTSAAEGFIFLSGLVAGLVYRHLIERDGLGLALRRVLERAGEPYQGM